MEFADVCIIGGGASGTFASIVSAERKKRVFLLEKNKTICKKLLLTGNKRCNLTNMADIEEFIEKYRNGDFLRNVFYQFFNTDLIDFFEKHGFCLLYTSDAADE